MINNDILRRIRYIFDFSDAKMITIFGLADCPVTREQISQWLKRDDDADFSSCNDLQLAIFLNGLIIHKRGRRDDDTGAPAPAPAPEKCLNNNLIFTKLKIALNLKSDDILELLDLAGFKLSKHELSAFFRKPGHKHHRACHDQVLRNFLQGLQIKHRGENKNDNDSQPGLAYPWKSRAEISNNSD